MIELAFQYGARLLWPREQPAAGPCPGAIFYVLQLRQAIVVSLSGISMRPEAYTIVFDNGIAQRPIDLLLDDPVFWCGGYLVEEGLVLEGVGRFGMRDPLVDHGHDNNTAFCRGMKCVAAFVFSPGYVELPVPGPGGDAFDHEVIVRTRNFGFVEVEVKTTGKGSLSDFN